MLSIDLAKRPASVADVMAHPFFTSESDLDAGALKAQFKAQLAGEEQED